MWFKDKGSQEEESRLAAGAALVPHPLCPFPVDNGKGPRYIESITRCSGLSWTVVILNTTREPRTGHGLTSVTRKQASGHQMRNPVSYSNYNCVCSVCGFCSHFLGVSEASCPVLSLFTVTRLFQSPESPQRHNGDTSTLAAPLRVGGGVVAGM